MGKNKSITYVPCTPAGTPIMELESKVEGEAIRKLLKMAEHMPYKTWAQFKKRGYTIATLIDP